MSEATTPEGTPESQGKKPSFASPSTAAPGERRRRKRKAKDAKPEFVGPGSRARLSSLRVTPRKARIIANMIRGQNVVSAVHDLRFMHKAGAREIFKLLVSAIANAEHKNENVDIDSWVVRTITVDEGPTMRRFRPRAQGRATRVEKKTSHIFLELSGVKN